MTRTRIAVPSLVVLAALVVSSALVVVGVQPAAAAVAVGSRPAEELRDSVLVTGRGVVMGEPDTLTANFAVESGAATVDGALGQANAAATRMRNALLRAGVGKADLQTSDLGISARRDDKGVITGYTVNQGLTAKIRNMSRAGAILSSVVAAGGDAARLNGVSFAVEDDAALLTEARRKAFADARAKAELYAREAGRSLGRVVRVVEETPAVGEPWGQHRYAAADSAVPVEPGRQQLAVSVTVEWALGDAAAPRRRS